MKKKKPKKKSMSYIVMVLLMFITLPGLATRSEAASCKADNWDLCFDTIPTRVLAGMTFSNGPDDAAGNLSVNLPNDGLVVTYQGDRMLEVGMLTGSLTGASGSPESPNGAAAALGVSGCVIEWLCGGVSYVFDTSAPTNTVAMVNADLQKAVGKIVDLIKRGVDVVPNVPVINPAPGPAASLPSFHGLTTLTP